MKTALLAGACLCALFASANAQTPTPRPLVGGHGNNVDAFIAQHDENADGRLTWAEFETFRRKRFDATDTNRDGAVDVEEYVQEFEDRTREQYEQGRAEQLEQTRRRFAALDGDKDGKVSRAEFDASGERVWSEGQKALQARRDGASADGARTADAAVRFDRTPNRFAPPSSHTAEGFLALFDGNGDGQVGRDEFDRERQAHYARSDANRDGVLDLEEYLAEYEARLDRHIATMVTGSDKQTRVRFGALDADRDGRMTFAEYQVSGKRTFDAADRNRDGTVDAVDARLPPPARPERAAEGRAAAN